MIEVRRRCGRLDPRAFDINSRSVELEEFLGPKVMRLMVVIERDIQGQPQPGGGEMVTLR